MNICNPMLDAKASRKRAEVDLQLLANRVALLKAEEAKALQKVNVTKVRAKDIIKIKKRNESSGTDRASTQMLREEQVRQAREQAQARRDAAKKRLAETQRLVHEGKQAVAVEKRKDMERRLEEKNRKLVVEEVEKRQKAEEQRRRHEMIKIRTNREKEEKELKAAADYSRKLEEEVRRAEEAEVLIAQLQAEEAEMIDRLRNAHNMQQSAYKTLKASLDA
eukprot:GSChrysophyteH1.ASY1.ANO1.2515.1 assembled CDS